MKSWWWIEPEAENGRGGRGEKGTLNAADAAEAQKKLTIKIRSKYERSQLVESFCTDRDDIIRLTDRPERFQDIMAGRSIPADDERSEEAEWMAAKLAEKIIAGVCAEDREQCSIERNIGQIEV